MFRQAGVAQVEAHILRQHRHAINVLDFSFGFVDLKATIHAWIEGGRGKRERERKGRGRTPRVRGRVSTFGRKTQVNRSNFEKKNQEPRNGRQKRHTNSHLCGLFFWRSSHLVLDLCEKVGHETKDEQSWKAWHLTAVYFSWAWSRPTATSVPRMCR